MENHSHFKSWKLADAYIDILQRNKVIPHDDPNSRKGTTHSEEDQ